MSNELFQTEQAVIAAAEARLEAGGFKDADDRRAFVDLLRGYEKLFKTTQRLIRLSDRTEAELSALAEQRSRAVEETARKNKELETLSLKLAKYLSPQVYDSIFSGRQEVKIASQRKKLTVLFSDIADFTEASDQLESEDLTQLLNHYLTEMSRVALQYGATIDKYIGDAIMIFFGDPETRGVKEDALACVKMAIAMQKRMRELAGIWRASGVEKPLQCRIGIHTGYCTVGNFGSEDRMDYTIVGGGVNLASRLEHAAPPGGILISYETYAHVRQEVHCESCGSIRVKGIAHPVAAYQVVDLYESLIDEGHLVHEDHPCIKIDLNLGALPEEERRNAASTLQRALDRILAYDRYTRSAENGDLDPCRAPKRARHYRR